MALLFCFKILRRFKNSVENSTAVSVKYRVPVNVFPQQVLLAVHVDQYVKQLLHVPFDR